MKAFLLKFLVCAFLFSVFSKAALAEPMKDQILISAPIPTTNLTCTVLNVSDRVIRPEINIADHVYAFPDQELFDLPAGQLTARSVSSAGDFFVCVVEWVGTPGEIRATACAARSDVIVEGYACLELR